MTDQINNCYICGEKGTFKCSNCQRYACSHHWYYSRALECIECHNTRDIRDLERAKEIANGIITEHLRTLKRRRSQLLIYDDYGIPDSRKWSKELNNFLCKAVLPFIGVSLNSTCLQQLIHYVDEAINENSTTMQAETQTVLHDDSELTPSEFENRCSDALRKQGWQTRLTKSTGDQGVDIVAARNGLTLVFQCKLYTAPVGNKAVQEVHAGKDFLKADMGVVVSNADFTPSARELAHSLNVLLLHDSELENFDKTLFLNTRKI